MDQTPVQPASDLSTNASVPAQPSPSTREASTNDVAENKDIAALGYAWILSVFVYLYRRNSPFIRFHAKQGIVLFTLSVLFLFLPGIFRKLTELVILGYVIVGFISAAQGQWRELPLIYAISSGDVGALRRSWKDLVQSVVHAWHRMRGRAGKTRSEGAQSSATREEHPASSAADSPNSPTV